MKPLRVQRAAGRFGAPFVGVLVTLVVLSGTTLATQQADCIEAETLCLQQPDCNASYQLLGQCKPGMAPGQDVAQGCPETRRLILQSPLGTCKCPRKASREKPCLKLYWALRPILTTGFPEDEGSPYDDAETEQPIKTDVSQLATKISDSFRSGGNLCLKVAHACVGDHRCWKFRNDYVQACKTDTVTGACDRRKCHRQLRHFFDKVASDITRTILLCPCQDADCAERRRQTIVPQCSHEEPTQRNCLLLMDSCHQDHLCRSRLAHFQLKCQSLGPAQATCGQQQQREACLDTYLRMIGTSLTPNYVSNTSLDISPWCTCEGSGNLLEECNDVLNLFSSNLCLRSAMQAQMGLNEALPHALATSGTFQRNGGHTSGISETEQVVEVDASEFAELQKVSTWDTQSASNSTAAGAPAASLSLTLLLGIWWLLP